MTEAPAQSMICQREGCDKPIIRHVKEGPAHFLRRRFCSTSCAALFQHSQKREHLISRDLMLRLVAQGLSDRLIGERYGVNDKTIWKWRKGYGIGPALRKPPPVRAGRGNAMRTVSQRIAERHWRDRIFQAAQGPKETVEEYLARGGQVTRCPEGNVNPYPQYTHTKLKNPMAGAGQCR